MIELDCCLKEELRSVSEMLWVDYDYSQLWPTTTVKNAQSQ